MSQIDELRSQYIEAVSNLFDAVRRDPSFEQDPALKSAAIAAQTASGKVESFSLVDRSDHTVTDEQIVTAELRRAEVAFRNAVEQLLGKTIAMADKEVTSATRELADAKRRFEAYKA